MTTKLKVYNQALLNCRERKLSALDESGKPRRLCDQVYDDAVQMCLEEALWKFATKAVRMDYDSDISPDFGFRRGYTKPSDWVKTVAMCSDEFFGVPLTQYAHENGYWYCDIDQIYVKYVSNADTYGLSLGDWPQSFADYVSAEMAKRIVGELTSDENVVNDVRDILKECKKNAKGNDAWNQPQKFSPPGNWASSRGTGSGNTRDRGNRHQLIG